MALYRVLLIFDLLFAIACILLLATGVIGPRPADLAVQTGLPILLLASIGTGVRLRIGGRLPAANLVLGFVALCAASSSVLVLGAISLDL